MTEYMTDTELKLAGLGNESPMNISLIKYYTLPGDIPGLMMIYGKNVPVNLCALDKGFDALEETALAAFAANPGAAADDTTKNILLSRRESKLPSCLEPFEKYEGSFLQKLTFEKNFINACQPFIYYFLNEAFEGIGAKPEFLGNICGYRSKYIINCRVNGQEKILPLAVSRDDLGAVFEAGNLLSLRHSVRIALGCGRVGFYVSVKSRTEREILREYAYNIEKKTSRLRIYDGGLVYDKKQEMLPEKSLETRPADIKEIINITEKTCCIDTENYDKYLLPWGGVCMVKSEELLHNFIIAEFKEKYAVIRHFYREYVPFAEGSENKITVFSFNAVHEIFPEKNTVQTKLIPTGEFTSGRFKERLSGRYFTRELQ
ncbi:MAG: hypothetical protein K2N72_11490 [Oscillospiraceae bacterium]|nr:hypothetical protein [Oscillospiraceae bacterium]